MDKAHRQGQYQIPAVCRDCGDNRHLFHRYFERTRCHCGGKYKIIRKVKLQTIKKGK